MWSEFSFFFWTTFIISVILGAVVNKTNFCTMGAVSDSVNMGDHSRMRAWFLAMAVAIVGVIIFEFTGMMSVDASFPPYRASQLILAENILPMASARSATASVFTEKSTAISM